MGRAFGFAWVTAGAPAPTGNERATRPSERSMLAADWLTFVPPASSIATLERPGADVPIMVTTPG
jgi:hypothetical protein